MKVKILKRKICEITPFNSNFHDFLTIRSECIRFKIK